MSVVSDSYLRDMVAAIRAGSDDTAHSRLKVALESVFVSTCDDLKDIVAGRMVNKGVDGDTAREAATAIEEYEARVQKGY